MLITRDPTADVAIIPPKQYAELSRNRNDGHTLIDASNDIEAVNAWIDRYLGHTRKSHEREAERLLFWCAYHRIPISGMTMNDCLAYRAFLADPQPADYWISEGKRSYPRHDARWRPFKRKLNEASIKHANDVIGGLFNFLVNSGYLRGNPWSLLPKLSKPRGAKVTRYIDKEAWAAMQQWLKDQGDTAVWVRRRFIFNAFYLSLCRLSELAEATMRSVEKVHRPSGIQWWLRVRGKGNIHRRVPIPHLIPLLREYRASRGLPSEPHGEDLPLIGRLYRDGGITASGLHKDIITTIKLAKADLPAEIGERIESATAHWLRHTAATHAIDRGETITSVQQKLGHASLDTTTIYTHGEDDERYNSALLAPLP